MTPPTQERGPAEQGGRRVDLLWSAAAVLTVALAGLVPLVFASRYYFNDDTQIGAFGIWFRLGELLRDGGIPFIEPSTWMAGNYFVEGQWGLFNPLILGIGYLASVTGDAVVFSTVVKIVFLAVFAAGVFGLARSYGALHVWAYVAAVSVPLAGFTFYMDAATWVTGLFTSALIPWAWWMLRRTAFRGKHFLPAFVAGYLVVTVGYVHGTIALVVVIVVTLVDLAVARSWATLIKVVLIGAALGLVAIAVYLPGVLTSRVTVRGSTSIMNDGFFVADLNGLVAGAVATSRPEVSAWWGPFATVPLLYISWALPLLAFVDVSRVRALLRPLAGILIFLGVMVLWIIGPSYAGPLRIPVRMMPYVALAVMVVFAVLLSRARARSGLWTRFGVYLVLVGVGSYAAFVQTPDWVEALAAATALLVVFGVVFLLVSVVPWAQHGARRTFLVGGLAFVAALSTATVQHHYMPGPPLADFQLPASTSAYTPQLAKTQGDVFVVGEPTGSEVPAIWEETLLANQWYLNSRPVQNVYTPVGFGDYAGALCMNNRGETCAGSLDVLLAPAGDTGVPLVDLMGISSIQLVRSAFEGGVLPAVADGWTVVDDGRLTQTWTRTEVLPGAGNVSHTSPGLEVTTVESGPDELVFRVDAVPEGGGDVVMSRLAWPGYRVDGASMADPVSGILLAVSVSPDAVGETVTVSFRPPGWTAEIVSLVLAVGGVALAVVVPPLVRRRRSVDARHVATPEA